MEGDENRKRNAETARRLKEAMKYKWCRNPLAVIIWKENARGEVRPYKGDLNETGNN